MTTTIGSMDELLESIAERLDIPPSYYQKAEERYLSLGEWLRRPESRVAKFFPHVCLQGSFRYGTVNRPLLATEEYDLDLVCIIKLLKSDVTQEQLKHLLGEEIRAYAERYSFNEPPTERNRCWRLDYADDVSFHMDILPCVPEEAAVIAVICGLNVPRHLAEKSVAITDRRHAQYKVLTRAWPCSNPRGLGDWFEERMRPVARARMKSLVEGRVYATIDDVPAYEWKTPLQRSIQLLKRHRDVMFKDQCDWAPISMIITILAARAYQGQASLADAIQVIVDKMPDFVREQKPRIPNPVNPAEDFADRWASDPRYEQNFWVWHTAVKADLAKLLSLLRTEQLAGQVRRLFRVDLPEDATSSKVPAVAVSSPVLHIATPARPWRANG